MAKQNTGKDRADQLRQEMKKIQHKQNTTTNLHYLLGYQYGSFTKTLQKIGRWLQNMTCGLSE